MAGGPLCGTHLPQVILISAENVPPVNVTGLPAPHSAGTVSVPWNPAASFLSCVGIHSGLLAGAWYVPPVQISGFIADGTNVCVGPLPHLYVNAIDGLNTISVK